MRPVDRKYSAKKWSRYGDAKSALIACLGAYCSYCEQVATPQNLDVEHLYPKTAHPALEKSWHNFLLACKTCNSYKSRHLENTRQQHLLKSYLWPHLDNTFRAFVYEPDGRIRVNPNLPISTLKLAEDTLAMLGLNETPAIAASYKKIGIAYDCIQKRKEVWDTAKEYLRLYRKNKSKKQLEQIVKFSSVYTGFFSIWMRVFEDEPNFLNALVAAFKAAQNCFDESGKPLPRSSRL